MYGLRGVEHAGIHQRRRAATSPGRRRAACTPVAQVRWAILPGARLGGITRFAPPDPQRPVPAPPACGLMGMCGGWSATSQNGESERPWACQALSATAAPHS